MNKWFVGPFDPDHPSKEISNIPTRREMEWYFFGLFSGLFLGFVVGCLWMVLR